MTEARTFRRLDLAGLPALQTRLLENLLARNNDLLVQREALRAQTDALRAKNSDFLKQSRDLNLEQQNVQQRTTIAQVNQKPRELSLREQEAKERDYQWVMAQQSLLAGLSDLDPAFGPLYEACRTYTMLSVERLYALYKAIEYVTKARIPEAWFHALTRRSVPDRTSIAGCYVAQLAPSRGGTPG